MQNLGRTIFLSSASAFVLMSMTSAAHADNAATGQIEEIVVTAQKVQQSANDVGMSITAVTGDDLVKANITSPDQLTKVVPGLNVTDSGNGTSVYTMRGVGFYDVVPAASPAVTLYLDEVPLPYPIMARGTALDVQRLEVLKGPQGTLFGQNATGGAINFIANRPTSTFEAGLDAAYSSYDRTQISGFLSGPISSQLKGRVAVSADNGGAWQKSVSRDATFGATRFYSGRGLVDWSPSDRLTVQFGVNGWVDKSSEPAAQIIAITNPANLAVASLFAGYPKLTSSRQADWDPNPTTRGHFDPVTGVTHNGFSRDNSFWQLTQRISYDVSDSTKLVSITAFEKFHLNTFVDNDGLPQSVNSVSSIGNIQSFSQELRLNGKRGDLQWVLGGNFSHDRYDGWNTVFNDIGSYPFHSGSAFSFQRTTTYAAFAHIDYALTRTLNLVAGIRYTDTRQTANDCTHDTGNGELAGVAMFLASLHGVATSIPAGGCVTLNSVTFLPGVVNGKLHEHNVPYTVGLNWKVAPNSLLYASINRGYKAGGFSPSGAIDSSGYDPAVQEQVLAYEAGFKLGLANRHVQLNGAGFYYDYANKQVRGTLDGGPFGPVGKLINVPKSSITGAELQVTVVPDSHWRFEAGVTYVDSEILGSFVQYDLSGIVKRELGGTALPLTPKWQGQVDLEYTTPIVSGIDALIGAHARYQDKSFGGLGDSPAFQIDSYTMVDLRAGVRADHWSASVFVNNLTDEYSWNSVNHNGSDAFTRIANPPRIMGIRASLRY